MYRILRPPRVAFKGHIDSGSLNLVEPDYDDGVFKAAMKLRSKRTDQKSSDLFLHPPCNASYLIWKVQNDTISIMGNKTQKQTDLMLLKINTFRF